MYGWFQKLRNLKVSSSKKHEQNAKVTSASALPSFTSSVCSLSSSSQETVPSRPQKTEYVLSSQLRWRRKYDLLVCHSCTDCDTEEAERLVSFLEASPRSLRCFLWQRDVCLGGAVCTEFCQAVKDSHLQALLITPNFLQDEWCMYMMHQALAEGPMSNRVIPLMQNLSHAQYPQELKFCFYVNLSRNSGQAYNHINKTVLKYLEDMVKNERTHDCSEDELISNSSPAGTSVPLEVMQKRDESFNDVCSDNHQQ